MTEKHPWDGLSGGSRDSSDGDNNTTNNNKTRSKEKKVKEHYVYHYGTWNTDASRTNCTGE